jgi:hypothetical protein
MAKAVGASPATVQRIWSARGLKPHLVKTFKLTSSGPRARPAARWRIRPTVVATMGSSGALAADAVAVAGVVNSVRNILAVYGNRALGVDSYVDTGPIKKASMFRRFP